MGQSNILSELRPWQPKAVERILDCIHKGKNKIILDAPTGSGKTLISLLTLRQLKKELARHSYMAVRTINQKSQYDRDIPRFNIPVVYKYLIGKRRGCPFWMEGDDGNTNLCDACLRRGREDGEVVYDEDNARRLIRSSMITKTRDSGDLGTQRTIILTSAEAYGIEIKGENRWKTFENASLSKNEPRAKERLEGFA